MDLQRSAWIVRDLEEMQRELRFMADPDNFDGESFERTTADMAESLDWLAERVESLKADAPNSPLRGELPGTNNGKPVDTLHAALDFAYDLARFALAAEGDLDDRCGDFGEAADVIDTIMDNLSLFRWFREGVCAHSSGPFMPFEGLTEPQAARLSA